LCGIAGFAGPGSVDDLAAMTAALAYRGPDDDGSMVLGDRRVHFGHRRLAVIDVEGGKQPMWSADKKACIVFNGEIYNHAELRAELAARGRRFLSDHSDTEVLLNGYLEWGTDLLPRLNGMFAFCIYDAERQRLVLARDRFGEKPLFYSLVKGGIAFASELRALTSHPSVPRALCDVGLQKFFAYGFFPAPHTLFAGCLKLPAGGVMTYDLTTDRHEASTYWRFALRPDESLARRSVDELGDELQHLLGAAVDRRLASDVPLGVFLSGGIDSSLIAALVARRTKELSAFTVGFQDASFDETAYAEQVARHLGIPHRVERLQTDSLAATCDEVLRRFDEPLCDPSMTPTFILAKFVRRHVTVALTGDGGDELFAGYDPFKALNRAALYKQVVPGFAHPVLRLMAERLPASTRNMAFDYKVRRALRGVGYPPALWNPVWLGPLEPEELKDLFRAPLPAAELYREAIKLWDQCATDTLVDRTLEFYTRLYLPEQILVKADRSSMLNSLETRAVFLDNDLADFVSRLPHALKFRGGETKFLLKHVARRLLPAAIVDRPKKGFGIPLVSMLRSLPETPPSGVAIPGIRPQTVETLWTEHRRGLKDHRLFIWSWLSLQRNFAIAL
jgi:asparagine synthase (glutamine-hydrolysing)